jgi:hypothetical protein
LYGGAIGGSGAFEFTAADYQVDENGTNVLVSVRRRGGTSGAPNGDVFVTLSTSNGTAFANTHYQPVNGSLAFPPGETFENVLIPVVDDLEINLDRAFSVLLSNPLPSVSGGPALGNQPNALVTIINDDSAVQFASPGFSTVENDPLGSAFVQIRRVGSSRGAASVDFVTTTNGGRGLPRGQQHR